VSVFTKFFGRAASEGAGFALGVVAAPALEPAVQTLVNDAWHAHPDMPIDAMTLAAGVVSGEIPRAWAEDEAARTGYNSDRFGRLVEVIDTGPGIGQAFRLWRRGKINDDGFKRALRRANLEPEWIDALAETKVEPLTPEIVANAVQQGFLPNDGLLPDAGDGSLPMTPPTEQVNLDPSGEASQSGVPSEHLRVLAQLSGNPPGPMQLLDLWNRGIITEEAVDRGIREGRTKTKWTPALKHLRWNVLSGAQLVGLWLRGWMTEKQAKDRATAAGWQAEDLDWLYKLQGRPATVHQAHIGFARGGRLPGAGDDEQQTIRRAVEESNIRAEWFDILYAQRYTYPSAFVLRALTSDGTFTADLAESMLVESGWKPEWAKLAAGKWAASATGDAGTSYVSKAQTQLWSTTHRSFIAGESSATEAKRKLGQAGVPVADRDAVIGVWTNERELVRKQLTPAQVKKAFAKPITNQATNAPWTRDDAIAALIERGYSPAEANEFLDL
jgi:hypothetical protein